MLNVERRDDAESACHNDTFDHIHMSWHYFWFLGECEESYPGCPQMQSSIRWVRQREEQLLFPVVCAKSIEKGSSSYYAREQTLSTYCLNFFGLRSRSIPQTDLQFHHSLLPQTSRLPWSPCAWKPEHKLIIFHGSYKRNRCVLLSWNQVITSWYVSLRNRAIDIPRSRGRDMLSFMPHFKVDFFFMPTLGTLYECAHERRVERGCTLYTHRVLAR